MVKAILEGQKTVTRRIIKSQPESIRKSPFVKSGLETNHGYEIKPYAMPGQILWVRETFTIVKTLYDNDIYFYKADNNKNGAYKVEGGDLCTFDNTEIKWKPSLFMPREACRIFLEVLDVRAERLQEITPDDILKEGLTGDDLLGSWKKLWDGINAERGFPWSDNPWVWRIEFKRTEKSDL